MQLTEEQRKALIAHIETELNVLRNVTLKHCDECEREDVERDIQVQEIAMAALTAEPVAYVHPAYLQPGALGFDASVGRLAPAQIELFISPPAPALRVPDGWKLVPVEPTEAMLMASYMYASVYSAESYRAMLAAAPEPE